MRNTEPRRSRRRIAAIAILTIVLLGGGGATTYAYWTISNPAAGSGAVPVGTPVVTGVTVTQTSVSGPALAPGAPAIPISGTIVNTNSGPIYVTKIIPTITNVQQATGATGTCLSSDFVLNEASIPVAADIPAGAGNAVAWSGLTISMTDTKLVQDGCKSATITISYAISAT